MKVIEPDLLDRAVERMAAALQPETIYLYGSHAYGQPHQDSDVDSVDPNLRSQHAPCGSVRHEGVPRSSKIGSTETF